MKHRSTKPGRYNRRDVGSPITIGRFRLEPVAQVVAFRGAGGKASSETADPGAAGDTIESWIAGAIGSGSGPGPASGGGLVPASRSGSGAGAGAFVRVTPIEVIVHDEEAGETRVGITDITGQAIRGMTMSALAIGAVGAMVVLLATVLGRRG